MAAGVYDTWGSGHSRVIDLLRNTDIAGVDRADVLKNLAVRVRQGHFDRDKLLEMATRFGRREEIEAVRTALREEAA